MTTFAVTYRYQESSDAARAEHRPAHIEFLRGLYDSGQLYMSGPLATEPARALLILEAADEAAVAASLHRDPFFANGLIAERTIAPWNVFFDPRTKKGA